MGWYGPDGRCGCCGTSGVSTPGCACPTTPTTLNGLVTVVGCTCGTTGAAQWNGLTFGMTASTSASTTWDSPTFTPPCLVSSTAALCQFEMKCIGVTGTNYYQLYLLRTPSGAFDTNPPCILDIDPFGSNGNRLASVVACSPFQIAVVGTVQKQVFASACGCSGMAYTVTLTQ